MKSSNDQWNSKLYDQSHAFVSKLGQGIVELLAPKAGERILDLGCGTGDLANQLTDLGAQVVGIDQSENMIQEAKEKYPHITFHVEDATALPYRNEFDAVFSNATLHWIKSPKQALTCIYDALKPGGRFVAEFGGENNVEWIINAVLDQFKKQGIEDGDKRIPWYFPSIGEYTSLMEEVGFRVTFAQHFDRPTPLEGSHGLKNWLEMFGSSLFKGLTESQKAQLISGVEDSLREVMFRNGQWLADYKRIRVVGMKGSK
ncbi:methyltransferase domain-containing protein [Lederbergia sp. NSJ-179]|uniref:class I SAM-dependent methyltransferase n=1 Tax=Lederbergia sp. NSJ-179 TaxID=2931402 RepID=UPI001FD5E690|nr:class I SAM-dependent methyltransferase [Lederbergia sp. NSJ-179]MCJ7840025.1 methyltransferase domain-containing protein [Lederbergia sp. NSJ-179]